MPENLAIYIHYPFCKSKCPYCDFNSHVREKIDDEIWRTAYLKELAYFRQITGNRKITSIFFGGGTPSLMAPQTAESILNFISYNWQLNKNTEVTLEANPTSVEYQKFRDFRAVGINRVSIGVQSFDEGELKFLGREHSSGEAKKAIELAAGIFPRYSFDLIYALPGQRIRKWQVDLEAALKLASGHVSLYQLTIEANTNFAAQYKNNVFKMPENELAAEFYELTQNICTAYGLSAYEVSNHAAPDNESRHNLSYWRYGEYLGIGPGAHGRINGHASAMIKSPEKWLEKIAEQNHGLKEWIELGAREKFEEKIMMGMRLNNGVEVDVKQLNNVVMLEREGFIEKTGNNLKATQKGMLALNSVIGKLLN